MQNTNTITLIQVLFAVLVVAVAAIAVVAVPALMPSGGSEVLAQASWT